MDKIITNLIKESVDQFFKNAPEKKITRGVREIYYDMCPHCKTEIYEKHEYTEDGGLTWRHSDCHGLISREETPVEEIFTWMTPCLDDAKKLRDAAREALSLPASGEKKYNKQSQGGTFSTSNSSTIGNV
jgi:hypothetical protein